MATAKHARRMDVLNKAHLHDWEVQSDVFDDGNILRDVFTSELGVVGVCAMHLSMAPHTAAKPEVRTSLAQLLQSDHRPVG